LIDVELTTVAVAVVGAWTADSDTEDAVVVPALTATVQ
jgi:hypothetical protein